MARAKAIAIALAEEEYRRRGGGGWDPDPQPGPIGRYFREWAGALIERERKILKASDDFNNKRWRSLGKQFNKLAHDPSFEGTLSAVRVVWAYRFGWRQQQPS